MIALLSTSFDYIIEIACTQTITIFINTSISKDEILNLTILFINNYYLLLSLTSILIFTIIIIIELLNYFSIFKNILKIQILQISE